MVRSSSIRGGVLTILLVLFYFLDLVSARSPLGNVQLRQPAMRSEMGANKTTNAARLQAGMAPLKPRTLFDPTRVRRK